MSDESFNFDDSFDEILSQTLVPNEDIFDKLFSNDFEDESVLTELSTNESLPQIVLNFENFCNRENGSNNLFVDYVLGLTHLMQKLSQIEDEVIELWISSPKQKENCILSAVFKFLPKCYSQLCEPKVIDLSKFASNLRMSFYESIAFNVCQLMITLSKTHFKSVEPLLFKQLLSEQSVCTLLASDVLCFTARLSKSQLCYNLCSLSMTISSEINDSKLPNISSLTNRLIPFLTDIELGFLLKDFDFLTHSRVWGRLPNIFLVLSAQQMRDCFQKFKSFIESGKTLNKYNINVFKYLLMTDELDKSCREYCFDLIWKNFITLTDPDFYGDFVELLTILLPNHLNDSFIEKTFEKLYRILDITKHRIALDLYFIEKILLFFTRLAIIEVSDQMEKDVIQMISSYILFVYKNSNNFNAKYLVFNTLKEISLKSKLILIVDNCVKIDDDFEQEFVSYLQTIEKSQGMDEKEKIDYLQSIESKLSNQNDFKSNEVKADNNQMMEEDLYIEDNQKFVPIPKEEVVSDERLADKLIAFFEQNVRKNQSIIESNPQKGLSLICSDLNQFVDKLKAKY